MFGLRISSVSILPVHQQGGLLGFATCIINEAYFLGNLAIYSCPNSKLGFRIVYPNKKLSSGKAIDIFYPLSHEAGAVIEDAVIKEYIRIMDNFNHVGSGH